MPRRLTILSTVLILLGLTVFTFAEEKNMSGNEAVSQVITTESGLQYVDLVVGTGRQAELGDTATVHYTGWLADGKKFDSSRWITRSRSPFEWAPGKSLRGGMREWAP